LKAPQIKAPLGLRALPLLSSGSMVYKSGMLAGRPAILIAAIAIIAGSVRGQAEDFRELTDKQGRTIQAKILMVAGDEVEIEMANGRKFTLPLDQFSLSSQALIKEHGAAAKKPEPAVQAAANAAQDLAPDQPAATVEFSNDPIFQFTDLEFKERQLDHFRILTIDTKNDPADKYAEKVYELMAKTMPALSGMYEQQGFRAPMEGPNAHDFPEEDKRYRHRIYLVEQESETGPYSAMIEQYAKEYPSDEARQKFIQSATQVNNFSDYKHRFLVIRKQEGRPPHQLLAHNLGYQMVAQRTEQVRIPFWLRMGAGYYSEHQLFELCVVHYIDFQNYYDDYEGAGNEGQMTKSEVLSNSESWVKPLKALCKKEKRVSLERLFGVTTADLTPNDSAYAMALFSFMNSTPEMTTGFNKLLDRIKADKIPTPQDMADIFGHESVQKFEEAWYAYIMSTRFK